jgi:hypothetical protein
VLVVEGLAGEIWGLSSFEAASVVGGVFLPSRQQHLFVEAVNKRLEKKRPKIESPSSRCWRVKFERPSSRAGNKRNCRSPQARTAIIYNYFSY